MKKFGLLILLAAVAAGLVFAGIRIFHSKGKAGFSNVSEGGFLQELVGGESVTTEVNAKAPGFAGATFSEESIRSIDFIGEKVVLLEFWSVFCTSCIQEMPHLDVLHRKYRGQGLEVIGVNTDFFSPARVRKFLDRLDPTPSYRVIHDQDQSISKAFQVEALPVTVLIDSSGWIRMYHLGYKPGDERTIEKIARKWLERIKERIETVGPVEGRTAVAAAGQETIKEGLPLPGFDAIDAHGAGLNMEAYRRDRPSVIFFWSLFCQPCRQEMPVLAEEGRKLGRDGKAAFLSVNLDSPRLSKNVKEFLEKNTLPFPTLLDSMSDPPGSIAGLMGISYTPTLIIVGSDGLIKKVMVGSFTGEEMKASFRQFIDGYES